MDSELLMALAGFSSRSNVAELLAMKLSNVIYCGDNLEWMGKLPEEFVDLIYADPPFFSNKHYEVIWNDGAEIRSFEDRWQGGIHHYIEWMRLRCELMRRLLKPTGTLYLHCDWHASHYLKVMLDDLFDQSNFLNEIVWWYENKPQDSRKKVFPRNWDSLLVYARDKGQHVHNTQWVPVKKVQQQAKVVKIDGKRKALRDANGNIVYELRTEKVLGSVWDIPYIHPLAKERLGYPTQKPRALLRRIIESSSDKGGLVLDPFCGCGTSIIAAQELGREWMGIDVSPTACKLMKREVEKIGAKGVRIDGLPMSLDELKKLTPVEFQNWILGAMGGTVSKKPVHDMGIDGLTFMERIPVQVKQQEHVDRPVVDKMETAVRRYNSDALKAAKERGDDGFVMRGIIVAFSFSRGAHEEVARVKPDGIEIDLLRVDDVVKHLSD